MECLVRKDSRTRDQVVRFYKQWWNGLDFSTIDENEKFLEREFDRKLIQALKELRGDEALGPDGFTMVLFQVSTLLAGG